VEDIKMDKVILYGMGEYLKKYGQDIFKKYSVVGVSDIDEHKSMEVLKLFSDKLYSCEVIKVSELKGKCNNCDYVLITAGRYGELAKYLIDYIGLKAEKIRVYLSPAGGDISFYGEYNEDAIIDGIIEKAAIAPTQIHYLDVGSNDPIKNNNSYYLYSHGASGCLVDPLEEFQYASMISRPRDQFIKAAVSDVSKDDPVYFYVCDNPALSSLYDNHRKRWDGLTNNGLREKVEVKVIGINDIMEKMETSPEIIFIDAEGEDIRIAQAIDYGKYAPLIVCVEICGYTAKDVEEFVSFMKKKGYVLYTNVKNVNYIFVKEGMLETR